MSRLRMEELLGQPDPARRRREGAAARSFVAPTTAEIDAAVRRLPPLPALLQELLRELRDADADIKRLEDRIKSDPSLTTRVLKMANSPFYARSSEVVEVQRAVMTLGFKTVSNLVVAAGLRGSMTGAKAAPGFERNGIFLHSLATGLACARLGAFVPALREVRDHLFVAGLLHDVGRVALCEFYQPHAPSLVTPEDLGLPPSVEQKLLGTDHQLVGGRVHECWQLPEELLHPITRHHAPVEELAEHPMTLAVAVADAHLNRQGYARLHQQPTGPFLETACAALGVGHEKVADRLETVTEEVRSIAGSLA